MFSLLKAIWLPASLACRAIEDELRRISAVPTSYVIPGRSGAAGPIIRPMRIIERRSSMW